MKPFATALYFFSQQLFLPGLKIKIAIGVLLYYTNFCLSCVVKNKKATFNKSIQKLVNVLHNLITKPQIATKDFLVQKPTAAYLISSCIGEHCSMQNETTNHMI